MGLFAFSKVRSAASLTNDTLTIIASATKPLRVLMAKLAGADAVSADNQILLAYSSGGTTPGGGITPTRVDGGSGAASFTVSTTWVAQPALGAVAHRFAPNSNGGIDPFVALPGAEYFIPVGGQMSLRSERGTANIVPNFLIEEIGG